MEEHAEGVTAFLLCSVCEFRVDWQSGGTLFIASSSLRKQLLREGAAHRLRTSPGGELALGIYVLAKLCLVLQDL